MSVRTLAKFLGFFTVLISFQLQASPRTVFIHLFEWTWKDVAQECEVYLGPAGFSAVQVSPPHEHIHWQNSPWWERYQVVSYKLNSRSGNEAEFADMVQRCNKAGVDVYVDAVLNHMTGIPGGTGSANTRFDHYNYPGTFDYNDFHHCGKNGNDDIKNFSDRSELYNCELLDLADLATESAKVQNTQAAYLNHLLDLGVAGFRIDAAKHIPSQDLNQIFSKLKRSAYIYQEIIYDPNGPVQYWEYLQNGDVMAYDYPRVLAHGFQDNNPNALYHISQGFTDSDDSIVFVTNHDLERSRDRGILSYNTNQQANYRLAQIFMLAWPYGYPQLYSGYAFSDDQAGPPLNSDLRTLGILDSQNHCQGPWTCEHRLPEVAAMVDFRNQTDKSFSVNNWWSNNQDVLAFSRGQYGFVAINYSQNTVTREFATGMSRGNYCNILGENYDIGTRSCQQGFQVQSGTVKVTLPPMSAVVLLKKTSPQIFRKINL
jgi:alpha-amylase